MQVRLISLAAAGAVALALCLSMPGSAHATPDQELALATEAFEAGDYQRAIPLLTYLLYPNVRLSRKSHTVDARVMLGVAHLEIGNRAEARRELEAALFLDDQITLNAFTFSDDAIRFFEPIKQEFLAEKERLLTARAQAETNERLMKALENLVVIERRPYFINFVPMGAGQFQNGQKAKGALFFALEAGTCGASAALWVFQTGRYGFNGRVPRDEVSSVRTLQQWQVAAGVTCLVLMGAGIVDALIHYESETRLPADESLLPENLRRGNKPSSSSRSSSGSSVTLTPTASPSGAGVAMSWEF